MLSRKSFEVGLNKIEMSFNGFDMTKEKADLWYGLIKDDMDDGCWNGKINTCIVYCRKIPALADILDHNNYYTDPVDKDAKDSAMACRKRNPGCYQSDKSKASCRYCMEYLRG